MRGEKFLQSGTARDIIEHRVLQHAHFSDTRPALLAISTHHSSDTLLISLHGGQLGLAKMAGQQQIANIKDSRPDTGTIPVDQRDSSIAGSHSIAWPAIAVNNHLW